MGVSFRDLGLFTDWVRGRGVNMSKPPIGIPACPGIYAEIHWATHGVRIGETGQSLRGKFIHDAQWMEQMHTGTAPESQLRRLRMSDPHPIVVHAAEDGATGFEFFIVCSDTRLGETSLRQDTERFLFDWVRKQPALVDWNRQRSWRG